MHSAMTMSSSFMERRDSYAPSLASSFGLDSNFSSAFSTPVDDGPNPFELHDWSSLTRSASPPDHMFDMNMSFSEHDMLYSTPNKPLLGPSLMAYDYPYAEEVYSSQEQYFLTSPPELQYDTTSSPLGDMHTPTRMQHRQFIDPSATFLETYEPSTPMHTQMSLQSPATVFPSSSLTYFISPAQQKYEHSTPSPFDSAQSFSSDYFSRGSPCKPAMTTSAVLHRVTGGQKIRKPAAKSNSSIGLVPEGKFRCPHPGCKSEHAFKRQEHLKRHMKTHGTQKDLQCDYCHKKFQQDRSDNYRSHVRLHAKKDSKGSRTRYFAAAEVEVASWTKDRSRRTSKEDSEQPLPTDDLSLFLEEPDFLC